MNMNSTTSSDNGKNLLSIGSQIVFYTGIPLIIINVIGNLINITVFAGKKLRDTTMGFYMIFLSISDLLATYIVFTSVVQKISFMLDTNSIFMCKFHNYIYGTLPFLSPWILVLVSFDRFMAIRFPTKFPIIKTKKFMAIMIAVVVCICFIPNIGVLVYKDLMMMLDQNTNQLIKKGCMVADQLSTIFSTLGFYYCILLTSYIPFATMTTLNAISVLVLCRSRKKSSGNKSNLSKEKELAITLFSLNGLFIVAYTPVCIFFVLQGYYSKIPTAQYAYYVTYLLMMLSMHFRQTHSALQFFIYLFTNRVFRLEFLRIYRLEKYFPSALKPASSGATQSTSTSKEQLKSSF